MGNTQPGGGVGVSTEQLSLQDEYDLTLNIDTMDPYLIAKRGWAVRPSTELARKMNDRLTGLLTQSPNHSNNPSPRVHFIPNTAPNSRASSRPPSQPPSRPPSPGSTITDDLSSTGDLTPRDLLDLSGLNEVSPLTIPSLSFPVQPIPFRPVAEPQINYFSELEGLFTQNPHVVVGVIGRKNSGKTHILNCLSGSSLREGNCCHTEGVAFKIPKKNQGRDYLLVDSLGYESNIKHSTVKQYSGKSKNMKDADWGVRRAILDKKCVENMVQDMMFQICHYILFVVDEVSYNDQHLLHQLLQKKHKLPQSPTIIVVHNFKHAETVDDFNQNVQNNVLDLFAGELRTKEVHGGMAPFFVGDCNHTFIGRNGTECGKKFNELTFSLIRTWLASQTTQRIPSMRDLLTTATNMSVRKYLKNVKEVNMSFLLKSNNEDSDTMSKMLTKLPRTYTTPPISPQTATSYSFSDKLFGFKSVREDDPIADYRAQQACPFSNHYGEYVLQVISIDDDKNTLQLNKELKTDLFGLSILQNKRLDPAVAQETKHARRSGSLNSQSPFHSQ